MITGEPVGRRMALAMGALTLVALALRLYRLDVQSAWIDEAFTISAAASSWPEMIGRLVRDFNHPPLHTMLVRWWFALFGVGVAQARLLSALFGTLAVPALYWVGALIFDRRTAFLAAALLAVSQLGIVYSQEARAYSMLLFLAIVATGFFVRAWRTGSRRDFTLFAITATVMCYTHYYAVFAIAGLVACALLPGRRPSIPVWWWIVAALGALVAYLPWLTSGVVASVLSNPRGAVDDRLFAHLTAPLYSINWFNNGKLFNVRTPAPWWTFPAGCLIFTAPALSALFRLVRRDGEERGAAWLLALCWVVPVVGIASLGFFHLVYDVRHVSFATAPYYLLVARGVMLLNPATARRLLVIAIFGYSTLSFRADYFVPYKDDVRSAVQILAEQAQPSDCLLLGAVDDRSTARLYWDSYYHGRSLPQVVRIDEVSSRSECARIWLTWDKSWWKRGPRTEEGLSNALTASYHPAGQWSFTGMDVQLFVR